MHMSLQYVSDMHAYVSQNFAEIQIARGDASAWDGTYHSDCGSEVAEYDAEKR